jgi:molybdopterin-biosynthesis enzyme MoeA-like protein
MVDVVLSEILAVPAERSRGRHNPRAVKRKMSNFPTKSRAVPNPLPSQRIHYEEHIRIVAPVVPLDLAQIWQQQIQSWQASGLRRTEYCERHGLPPHTFNK